MTGPIDKFLGREKPSAETSEATISAALGRGYEQKGWTRRGNEGGTQMDTQGGRMKEPEISVERGAQVQLAQNPSPIGLEFPQKRKAPKGSQGTQREYLGPPVVVGMYENVG